MVDCPFYVPHNKINIDSSKAYEQLKRLIYEELKEYLYSYGISVSSIDKIHQYMQEFETMVSKKSYFILKKYIDCDIKQLLKDVEKILDDKPYLYTSKMQKEYKDFCEHKLQRYCILTRC